MSKGETPESLSFFESLSLIANYKDVKNAVEEMLRIREGFVSPPASKEIFKITIKFVSNNRAGIQMIPVYLSVTIASIFDLECVDFYKLWNTYRI